MKSTLVGILFAALILGGIWYYNDRWQQAKMEEFALERGLEMVDMEWRAANIGPMTYGRGVTVYRAVYKDKAGMELPYWFRFEGSDVCIYQEPSPEKYIHIK